MKSKKVKFKPLKFKCRDCGAEIQSKTSGQFSYCDCPEDDYIFIDQTYDKNGEGYIRQGGRPEKFIKMEDEVEEWERL